MDNAKKTPSEKRTVRKEREGSVMKNSEKRSIRILAKDNSVTNDTWVTGINNNDLIVGPSGGGKTRSYVTPNILHTDENLIVTDTKGNLCELYGPYLRKKGFRVMKLDFKDIEKTPFGFNPLRYIRRCCDPARNAAGDNYMEQDVKKLAFALCPICDNKDPFWDLAAQMYLELLILYVLEALPENEHDLSSVYTLLTKMGSDEFAALMDERCDLYPNSAIALKYRMVSQNRTAEKMDASIKGILARHLDVVSYSATKRMFRMEKQVDLGSFLEAKTALFINVSDSDRSQDPIINLFYTQALQFLIGEADKCPDSRLPYPVRFILDDFSTNTKIEDFDNIISVIRSREISVSIIIQSISQLEGLYGTSKAQTIINNCDHCLYLGGSDPDTARYFAFKFNCMPSTILNLPLDSAYLFTRGSEPKKVLRYDLNGDDAYCRLMQAKRSGGREKTGEAKVSR